MLLWLNLLPAKRRRRLHVGTRETDIAADCAPEVTRGRHDDITNAFPVFPVVEIKSGRWTTPARCVKASFRSPMYVRRVHATDEERQRSAGSKSDDEKRVRDGSANTRLDTPNRATSL